MLATHRDKWEYLEKIGRTYWRKMKTHECLSDVVASNPVCILVPCCQFFHTEHGKLSAGSARNPRFKKVG